MNTNKKRRVTISNAPPLPPSHRIFYTFPECIRESELRISLSLSPPHLLWAFFVRPMIWYRLEGHELFFSIFMCVREDKGCFDFFFEIQYTRRGNKAGWDVGEGLLLGYSTKRCQFGFVIFSHQFVKKPSWRGNLETMPLKADKSKFPVFICLCMGIRDISRKN